MTNIITALAQSFFFTHPIEAVTMFCDGMTPAAWLRLFGLIGEVITYAATI